MKNPQDIPSDSQSSQEFVSQTLALGNGGQTTLLNLLGIKLNCSLTELESLLHKRSEFTDSSSLVTEDFLSMRSADDDFCSCGRDTDFAARVALFSEFAGEEFIEFGEEDSVGDELAGQPGLLGTEKEGDLGGSGFVHYAFIDVRVRDVSNKRCQRTHHRATAGECGREFTFRFLEIGPG